MAHSDQSPHAELRRALADLRLRAGQPSTRAIARALGGKLSHDTVHRVLTEDRLPIWASLELVVTALGGDVEVFRNVWLASQNVQGTQTGQRTEPDLAPPAEQPTADHGSAPSAPCPVRVMIVDDDALIRRGLATLLRDAGYDVVAEADDGLQALELARATHPDVVVMDIRMPQLGGIEATRRLIAAQPGVRVLMLTVRDNASSVAEAFRAGATGYLVKPADEDEIVEAIRRTAAGVPVVSATLAASTLSSVAAVPLDSLTAREREVMRLVARGLTNSEIGRQLGISIKTVSVHVSNVYRKLNLTSRVSVAKLAVELELDQGVPKYH